MILNVPQIRSTLMDTYDNFKCSCTNVFPLFATLVSRIITLDDCDNSYTYLGILSQSWSTITFSSCPCKSIIISPSNVEYYVEFDRIELELGM